MRLLSGARERYQRLTNPNSDGLPNWKVFWLPPLLLTALFAFLVLLEITGSSTGMTWAFFHAGSDPNLIYGVPRSIRSDEWLVQQSWVISQSVQGFPASNGHFPGGMDMTVFNDLPVWEWASLFRPHTWGYLTLGLNYGASWFWNFPGLVLLVGVYQFTVTVSPRRVATGCAISVTVLMSPFVQWWHQATTVFSVAWVAIALTSLIWIIKSRSIALRLFWSFIFFYVTVLLALEIYVPFIIPGILIFFLVGTGILYENRLRHSRFKIQMGHLWRRTFPLLLAGFAAVGVVVIWCLTRISTIQAILNTVYPGERRIRTGDALFSPDANLVNITGGLWSSILKGASTSTVLGTSQSEASAALPVALVLLPAVIACIWVVLKRNKEFLAPLAAAALANLVFLAFLYLPGWDFVSHLIYLDRVPGVRIKIAFLMVMPVLWVFLVRAVDDHRQLPGKWLGLLAAVSAVAVISPSLMLIQNDPVSGPLLTQFWIVSFVLFVVGIGLLFIPRGIVIGSIAIAFCGVFVSFGVNPIYVGINDLNATSTGREIARLQAADPGIWIGAGGWLSSDLLTQSGVPSYTGVQNYPIMNIWNTFDPTWSYEANWNRLGHIQWAPASGPLRITNPQPDVITVEFDPCDDLVQRNTKYLFSSVEVSGKDECLTPIGHEKEAGSEFWFYKFKKNVSAN